MGFMMQIRPEMLKKLREDYPTGCRVELVQMFEEPRKDMVPGLTGEVMFVDDAGGVHIARANGSTLAAIHGGRHPQNRLTDDKEKTAFGRSLLIPGSSGLACHAV